MTTTILVLISRPEWLDRIFATLENLECNVSNTSLVGIVDGDASLYITARNKINASKFGSRLCVQYKSNDKMLNANIAHRQQRISAIHNFTKQYIQNTDYIFSLEDDTGISTTTLKRLQRDYNNYPFAGMISGVQIGRHGINHIGGWQLDDIYNPTKITSVPLQEGILEVDATGLYCCLIKAENYLKHEFTPYENTLGPDFNFGLALRQQGLVNYMDFDIHVEHFTKNGAITPKSVTIDTVSFVKVGDRWRQKSEVTT